MNRLRAIANDYLLPLVLGALVLRALIPAGFMPRMSAGGSFTALLCNAPATGQPRSEIIEIPGAEPVVHCDYCVVPVIGAGFTLAHLTAQPAIPFLARAVQPDAPHSRFALERAQTPRAPPAA